MSVIEQGEEIRGIRGKIARGSAKNSKSWIHY
jgi:hypothetical protein